MIQKSLKGKIIVPSIIVLTALVTILVAYASFRFSRFSSNHFYDRLKISANILDSYLTISSRESRVAAVSISKDEDVAMAVKARDTEALLRLIPPLLDFYNINFCTVTDETGTVLARTHEPGQIGDSVLGQQNIKDALNGKVSTYSEEGTVVMVSVRTGSPVYDSDGVLVGVISAGVRLDTNETVDYLKERYDADFSVFYGDTRVATTIIRDGNRIVGTKINPDIVAAIREGGAEYFGDSDILGEGYGTYYLPLINSNNEVFAMLSVVRSYTDIVTEKNSILISEIFIAFFGLVCAIAILLYAITRITNPVKRLTDLVLNVTDGNVDIDVSTNGVTKDEIGALTTNTYSLISTIRAMLSDLAMLTNEMNADSDVETLIDASGYKGAYREIVSGINDLANTVSMMKKTMTVMDTLVSMVIVVDFDYNLVYINRSLADTFLADINCYKGKKCYKTLRNLDNPCSFCLLPALLTQRDSFPSQEYAFLYDDACDMWLGGQASIIRWVDGSLVYFQSLNDESGKKQDQVALQEAVMSAEIASNAKSAFLANMSHELRTPLNVVIGLADLQLEDTKLSEDIRDSLVKISSAGRTLLSIVNDILDISKIESGNFELVCVDYHMASLLNDTANLITSRIGEKPIAFSLDIDEDLPSKLHGDDLRVKQILNNLLSNAIKYTHEGTIVLSVRCARLGDDIWMELCVKDTGIGIRPEDIEKLFSDYSQVDTQANRTAEGTGLGLAITKKLVESMDGEISVESEYGRGSAFYIKIRQGFVTDELIGIKVAENLRKARYSDNKHHFSRTLERADLSYARVLVVDDMRVNLDVSAGLMRKYNMQVDCSTSGRAAIERIKAGEPVYDAIFMDHMMPEMDGIEAADAIRALGTDYARSVPIIALTANAVVGTEELFYEHGFQAFISKPIDVMQLDSVIQQWVRDTTKDKPRSLPSDPLTAGPDDGLASPAGSDKGAGSDEGFASPGKTNEGFAFPGNSAPGNSPEEEGLIIEIPGIDVEKGLSFCDGDPVFFTNILRSYASDTYVALDRMRDVTEETLQGYTIAVHGIKSSSAAIGAESIREMAASLEAMSRKGDLTEIHARNTDFMNEVEHLIAAINTWLNSMTL